MSGAATAVPANIDRDQPGDAAAPHHNPNDEGDSPLTPGRRFHLGREAASARWVLSNEKRARAKYRDLAALAVVPGDGVGDRKRYSDTNDALSATEFRCLYILSWKASTDLSNSFLRQRTIAKALGVKPTVVRRLLKSLQRKGWIRLWDGEYGNNRRTSNLVQFLLPPGVLPDGHGWEGPVGFKNRSLRGVRITRRTRPGEHIGTGP